MKRLFLLLALMTFGWGGGEADITSGQWEVGVYSDTVSTDGACAYSFGPYTLTMYVVVTTDQGLTVTGAELSIPDFPDSSTFSDTTGTVSDVWYGDTTGFWQEGIAVVLDEPSIGQFHVLGELHIAQYDEDWLGVEEVRCDTTLGGVLVIHAEQDRGSGGVVAFDIDLDDTDPVVCRKTFVSNCVPVASGFGDCICEDIPGCR